MSNHAAQVSKLYTTPLISVIVPVRNAMPFLGEALASILQQDSGPVEIIVVDGDSSDGGQEVAAAIPQVQLVHQQGRGLADARNQGLALAKGELIAFLDADDRWPASRLTTAVAHLQTHPECIAVIGQMVRFLQEGVQLPPAYTGDWLNRPVAGYTPGALLARRSAFCQVGLFDATLSVGCDSDWFVRATDCGVNLVCLPQILLYKRIHDGNLSAQIGAYRRELLTVTRRSLVRRNLIPSSLEPSC